MIVKTTLFIKSHFYSRYEYGWTTIDFIDSPVLIWKEPDKTSKHIFEGEGLGYYNLTVKDIKHVSRNCL